MSTLPPPLPPRPDGPAKTAQSPDDSDWGRLKDLAERWFRPLVESDGWLALVYLAAGGIAAPILFGFFVAASAVTFGLLFVLVGFLLIVPLFKFAEVIGRFEQVIAAPAGQRIELRSPEPLDGAGLAMPLRALADPVRWRYAGFVVVNVVLAPVLLAIGSFPLSVVARAVLGDRVLSGPGFTAIPGADLDAVGFLTIPVVAVLAGAIPRVAIWVAELKAQLTNWLIGPDRLALAERRVSALSEQRTDILDAVANERRRIERNLHDGVQQQLVAIGLDLGMAEQQLDRDPARARELIVQARSKVQGSIGELRQLGRGLHPAILEDRGIDAALSAVVSGSPIPISVQVDPDLDLATDVEETVYFVANEAIANVLKHAKARVASVHVTKVAANVRVTVHDDGIGGADATAGTGIAGIRARVNAVDGSLTITSPPGGPTTIVAEIPRHAR